MELKRFEGDRPCVGEDMDDGVINRWVTMVVSLVFYVGEG
jgi:hypothetical protein